LKINSFFLVVFLFLLLCILDVQILLHEKNDSAKNLIRYRSENNFVSHQNNYRKLKNNNAAENFDILANLNVPHNYFHKSFVNYFQICI